MLALGSELVFELELALGFGEQYEFESGLGLGTKVRVHVRVKLRINVTHQIYAPIRATTIGRGSTVEHCHAKSKHNIRIRVSYC